MEEKRENGYVDEKEEKMSISHEHFNAMLERLTGRMHPLTGWFPERRHRRNCSYYRFWNGH